MISRCYVLNTLGDEVENKVVKNDLLYFKFDDFDHVMRHKIRLKTVIDGGILTDVVKKAQARYPYFCIRVLRSGEDYEIVHNDLPIPVREGETPVVLGSEENNGHFLAVSYTENVIIFDIDHNLADSKGLMEWLKTVVYMYLTASLDITLPSDNIRLPGEDYLPGETEDPYEHMDLDSAEPFVPEKGPVRSFLPDDRYMQDKARSNYVFRVSVDDLMRFSRSLDGSPAAVLCYFAKEMIRKLFPDDSDKPIVTGIPHSFRDIACGEANYHSQTVVLHVIYGPRMDSMPVEQQLTCTRGAIILQSDPDNVRYMLKGHAEFAASLDDLPTVESRRRAYKEGLNTVIAFPESLAVSYVGQIKWGSIEEYIEDIALESAAISAPIMFAFVPIKGWFYITMVLNQTSDIYVNTLVDLIRESGIKAENLYSFKQQLCRVDMP